MIELRCLGSVDLQSAGKTFKTRALSQPKRLALLVYLATATPRGFHQRDELVALFWPEADEAHARASLRITLHFLRRELGDVFEVRGDEVAANTQLLWCDVAAFDAALTAGALQRALTLYGGNFLPGFHLSDLIEFEHWVARERDRLRTQAHSAALALAIEREKANNDQAAAHWIRIALTLIPEHEESMRRLVLVLDKSGDRPAALRAYDQFAQHLAAELDARPSAASEKLIAEIRAREPATMPSHPPTQASANLTWARPSQPTNSILILPFADLGPSTDNTFFADGLTDELITDLSRVRSLRVISCTSAMRLKGTKKDLRDIGRELDVAWIVEGSVRCSGNELRINVKLIDATTDLHLWAEKYVGTTHDLFQFQESLSRTIVDALKVTLTPQEDRSIGHRRIDNPHAYECYLRARHELWSFSPTGLDRAIREIENALKIVGPDPLLFATKAYVTAQYLHTGGTVDDGYLEDADESVKRAFELEPESYYGYLARGLLLHIRGDFVGAARDLKRVLQINPATVEALLILAYIYALSGKEASAKPLLDKLLEIDPLTPMNHAMPGFVYALEGHPEKAIEGYRRFYELAPENPAAQLFYCWVLAWNGQFGEVGEIADRLADTAPGTPFASAALLIKYAVHGDRHKAVAAITPELRGAARGAELFSRVLASFLALAGETDEALSWLANANRLGFINYPFLAHHDRMLDNIRNDSRFGALLESVRSRWETFQV